MDITKDFLHILSNHGYTKINFGYRKTTDNYTHWITFFGESLQMYGYVSEDPEFDKVYDTGVISVSPGFTDVLINVFTTNHK